MAAALNLPPLPVLNKKQVDDEVWSLIPEESLARLQQSPPGSSSREALILKIIQTIGDRRLPPLDVDEISASLSRLATRGEGPDPFIRFLTSQGVREQTIQAFQAWSEAMGDLQMDDDFPWSKFVNGTGGPSYAIVAHTYTSKSSDPPVTPSGLSGPNTWLNMVEKRFFVIQHSDGHIMAVLRLVRDAQVASWTNTTVSTLLNFDTIVNGVILTHTIVVAGDVPAGY
ncbi:hypothetical protein HD553DRAFT_340166 [Filobasidium floriforme]|uniref:uncharacterized protein n=1 Tax=Filobasidium floriforme TaxID=5210 RepID=UPI001E8EEB2F|nr:uncharacterized protein HD553DRAFT_340166 [Filobasidium floriforme]KAH8088049.1 hypothetical protein HD553DRAFT_340166 [Filobasidium floriforme]